MPKNLQKTFGGRLLALRKKAGWSQEVLSEKARISVQHISSMENGHREPCLNNIGKLAKVFGITISEMMKGL